MMLPRYNNLGATNHLPHMMLLGIGRISDSKSEYRVRTLLHILANSKLRTYYSYGIALVQFLDCCIPPLGLSRQGFVQSKVGKMPSSPPSGENDERPIDMENRAHPLLSQMFCYHSINSSCILIFQATH